MALTIYNKVHEAIPALQKAARYMELIGGLGDVFNHIHWLSCYRNLNDLQPHERAFVLCASHNARAHELFLWHPKADQIDLCNAGFLAGMFDRNWRIARQLPEGCSDHRGPLEGPVTFYPSPKDEEILREINPGRYLVFAVTAGTADRSIPPHVAASAAEAAMAARLPVYLVGNNYQRQGEASPDRQEIEVIHPNVISLVDRLTVPGTAKLVEGAAGVFACHSSICLLSWFVRRPTFLLYDNHARDTLVPLGPFGYMNGLYRAGGDSMHLSEYTVERLVRWMEKLP